MAWLYAPGMGGSSLESGSPSAIRIALCVTSNGTQGLRPPSWRGWGRRAWTRLLSGATCEPSMVERGVAAWMSSRLDTHVSRSRWPVRVEGSETSGTFGRASLESLARYDRESCSWRTSQGTFDWDLTEYSVTWPTSGSMQNGRCWARPTLARHTGGIAFGCWPTPRAMTGGAESADRKRELGRTLSGGGDLQSAVIEWERGRRVLSKCDDGKPLKVSINPRFTEWLMGVPKGWTTATVSGCSETEWSRWWRLMRSELWQIEQGYDCD